MIRFDYSLTAHQGPIYAISAFQEHLFSASGDQTVKKLNLNSKSLEAFTVRCDSSPISLLALTEHQLFVGLLNGSFFWINPENKKIIFEYHFNGDTVFSMASNAPKTLLFLGLSSGTLAIFDIENQEWLFMEAVAKDKIRTILVHPFRPEIYLSSKDGHIVQFDLEVMKTKHQWPAHDLGANALVFNSKNQLVSGGKDGHLKSWDLKSRVLLRDIPAHRGTIYGLAIVGPKLISVSRDKSIKVWDDVLLNPLQKLTRHKQSVNALVQQNEYSFVTASDDHTLCFWNNEI